MVTIRWIGTFIVCFFLAACRETVPINAQYKDIWVVHGMLRSGDTTHYVRIAKAFQSEKDANLTAKEEDLSAKNLIVILKQDNATYTAIELNNIPKYPQDGNFFPFTTLYEFRTPPLLNGKYELEIRSPKDSNFLLSATTNLPFSLDAYHPRQSYVDTLGLCLGRISIGGEDSVRFVPDTGSPFLLTTLQFVLELRENGVAKTAKWGAETPFRFRHVYNFRNGTILNGFKTILNQPHNPLYSIEDLPECGDFAPYFRLELLQLDSALTRYELSEQPSLVDFSMYRPYYTNVTGTDDAVGIFGSVGVKRIFLRMTEQEKEMLNLK